MFGFLKKGKKKKNDLLADNPAEESQQEEVAEENSPAKSEKVEEKEEIDESTLSPKERERLEKLRSVKSKISHILQSKDIEIIDENEGDDYEFETGSTGDKKKQQQDYDSLKARYSRSGKDKKQELTLQLDDFDYTYVGKYVDDYDVIHMKTIKRIKLPNKHAKLIKKIAIGVACVAVVIIGGVVAYNLTKVDPEHLTGAYLSQTSQSYYRNELFDFTGLYIYAQYSTGRVEKIPLKMEHFVSYLGGGVEKYGDTLRFASGFGTTLTFHYEGFVGGIDFKTDLDMNITIMTKNENGLAVIYSDGIFGLEKDEFITDKHLIPLVEYENYSSTKIELQSVTVKVDGVDLEYDRTAKGFKVKNDMTSTSKIEVSYRVKNSTVTIELDRTKSIISSKTVTE